MQIQINFCRQADAETLLQNVCSGDVKQHSKNTAKPAEMALWQPCKV